MMISVRKKSIKEELHQARTKIRYLNQELLEKEQEIQLLEARLKETPMYEPDHHEQSHTALKFGSLPNKSSRLETFMALLIGIAIATVIGFALLYIIQKAINNL